ncbi:hypothetical protein GMB50_10530 [Turicibacter sanguinis]|nr:hypothetical protein [Turicibacter sanguinis]MTP47955.1 hypothetical protein [Turicibacter sanguinis]MTP50703.1 hypothetical protein [Turicibacter sanguinis]MTQ07939.1 hypothetical protein [Turicibacter sanguinis]
MNTQCAKIYEKLLSELYKEERKILDKMDERYYRNDNTNFAEDSLDLEIKMFRIRKQIEDCYDQIGYYSEGNIYGRKGNWILIPPVNTPIKLYFRTRINSGCVLNVCKHNDEETNGAHIHRCISLICQQLKKYHMEPSFIKWQDCDFDFEWDMSDYVFVDSPQVIYDLISTFKTNIANCNKDFSIQDIKVYVEQNEKNKNFNFLKDFEAFEKYDINSLHHIICYDRDDHPAICFHLDKIEPTCVDYEGNFISFEDVDISWSFN